MGSAKSKIPEHIVTAPAHVPKAGKAVLWVGSEMDVFCHAPKPRIKHENSLWRFHVFPVFISMRIMRASQTVRNHTRTTCKLPGRGPRCYVAVAHGGHGDYGPQVSTHEG